MPLKDEEKTAIAEVVEELTSTVVGSGRTKRRIADLFEELVDKETYPDYYEVISQPRSINTVLDKLDADEYPDALEAWVDLELVFVNAMHYNKSNSQIWKDAELLKDKLGDLWVSKPDLPVTPPSTPSPAAAGPSKPRIPIPTLLPIPTSGTAPGVSMHKPAAASRAGPSTPAASRALPVIAPAPKASPMTPMQSLMPTVPTTPLPFSRGMSPPRPTSPDMDVDVGGTPEPEGGADETARDEEGVAIVQQLERGLPRWSGLGEQGWTWEAPPEKWVDVVLAIKGHKDAVGNRLAPVLENIPDNADIPYLSFSHPVSLKIIEQRARDRDFVSSKAFDHEMMRLFEKGRRWWEIGTEQYGHVVLLQRLYQALTGPHPPSGPPYVSQTNFGSLRSGPGSRHPDGQNAVTSFRVSSKDRTTAEEVHYKGWSFRLADWVHAYNSDDPSKPVMGQVFKAYVSDEPGRKGEPGITVCWYYRPEQTTHPAHRQFWENEVFKTSHFADHPLEDIIEKVAVQFTARHIRGRPRAPYWSLGWPLYVCDSRYNDRERVFVKIKNWNSCVPEEVRKSQEFMPIYPFERMVYPRRFDSPFLHGRARGPGGLGDPVDRADGERTEGGGTGRKRSKKPGAISDLTGPTKGLYVGVPGTVPSGSSAAAGTGAASSTGTRAQAASQAQQAAAYVQQQHQQQLQLQMPTAPRIAPTPAPKIEDRSVLTAAGGQAALGANASLEKLPAATTKHFDRDPESNTVLWFAAPPVDVPRAPPPQYSLKYLHWLATKKRRAEENDTSRDDGEAKRPRLTTTQRVAAAFAQEMVAES